MERVPGEGEAHIKPDLRGRARTTRRQAGLGGNGASAEWAHAGAGNQTQVARRVLKRQRQKNEQQAALFVGREKTRGLGRRTEKGAERGPASRRLSRIIGPERTFVLPLLRRGRT